MKMLRLLAIAVAAIWFNTGAAVAADASTAKPAVSSKWSKSEIDGALQSMIGNAKNDDHRALLEKLRSKGSDAEKRKFVTGTGPYTSPPALNISQAGSVSPLVIQCTSRRCVKVRTCTGPNNGPPCTSRAECEPEVCTPCNKPAC